MDSCRVAFIGAGYMTTEHVKVFANIDNVILCGIYSRTRSRAEAIAASFHNMICCDSIASLYETCHPDLVVISVPELYVRVVCEEAFKFPWTCLVEKPVGYNLEDASYIYETALVNNSSVLVGLNRRHYSVTKQLLADINDDKQPRLIHVFDQEDPAHALAAGKPELVVKNWMYANSIHIVDYLTFLGRGRILSVEPVVAWNPTHPSVVISKITFDSGDIGIYEAVWNAPGPWAVVVTTPSTRWELRPLEKLSIQKYGSRKQHIFEMDENDKHFKPGLRIQAEEAVKAVLKQNNCSTTLEESLKVMRLIKRIYNTN